MTFGISGSTLAAIGAGVGAAGSLASGTAGLIGALKGPGGGKGASIAPINPSAQFIASLFGALIGSKGDVQSGKSPGTNIFGQQQIENIRDFLNNPLPFNALEQGAFNLFGEDVQRTFDQTVGLFDNIILPGASELAQTGFRTDIEPIRQLALRNFQQQTIPGLREQFLGQTGSFSSDFLNSIAQAGGDLNAELGATQAELDEAAAQRRATGLSLLGQLSLARQDLPISVANAGLDFGGRVRLAQEALRPGGRTLDVLSLLSGLGAPQNLGFFGQGEGPSGLTQLLSGLASSTSAFKNAGNLLSGLFNRRKTDTSAFNPNNFAST